MSEQRPESQQSASLRERAEKAFREMPDGSLEDLDALSPEALRASLHELRVHQIELEMQNMEMVREREALADLQARYFDLYDLAPVSYCTIGERGLILEANLTASTLLRVKRGALVGRLLTAFISKEDQTPYYLCWKNLLDTREPQECDLRMLRHDGTAFFAHLNFTVARDKNGAPVCLVALSDITSRKQAEEALLKAHLELEERVKNRTEELSQSKAQLQLLLDSTAEAIYGLDSHGNCTFCNSACLRMLGYEREDELLGRNMHWQIHQKHADGIRAPAEECPVVRAFQANEGSHVDDEVLWRADGTSFPAEYWSYPQRIDGVAVGMVVTFIDITERKQVEEKLAAALELHKQLLENAPALIWRAGTDAKCSWFNTTWLEFTGRTMEQELGDGWAEGVHAEDFDRCLKIYLDAFAARRPFHMDYRLRRPDGTYSWISDFGISLKDISGGFCGYIGYCFDITGRMQAQEEILRINRELEEATAKAEKATAAKSEFLAIMSHEMRNPLTGILGFAELLAVTPLTGEQQSCTEAMQESGAHLLSLINDVLDFSSIEKGALAIHPAPFDLAHLVKFSSDIVRKSATDKGLTIHCDVAAGVPKKITGDERRIRQILINLLANAVKFTSDGSVSLRVAGSGEFLEFSVEDTGLGISSEALARLFKLFTQGDSTINQKYGGTGIGLAVSGRLAEAMGGTISVVSDPGKGTTFTLRLPLEVPAGGMSSVPSHIFTGDDGASPSSPGAETPVRIDGLPVLVADDDRNHSLMVGKVLQSLGYRAEFAANGVEAVDAFAPGKYLVILMDLQMPVMNGFEAAAIIRSRESTSRVPIIALTGNVMASSPEAYFAAGMDDFLSKPFKKEELAAKLACVA